MALRANIRTLMQQLRCRARLVPAIVLIMTGGALHDMARADGCGNYPADYKSPKNDNAKALDVTFHNVSSLARQLYWVDFQGERKPFGTIAPGANLKVSTYVGHVWTVTNQAGKCVDFIVAENDRYDVAHPFECSGGGEVKKCGCGVDYTGTPPNCKAQRPRGSIVY